MNRMHADQPGTRRDESRIPRYGEEDGNRVPAPASWRLEDINFDAIDYPSVNADEALLLMLVASSFVESATHIYASNLIAHFAGDAEVTDWLAGTWEREELQHGRALRSYVAHVWPDFSWKRAYARFISEYRPLCTTGKLERKKALEMVARCVVETGTTSLYRAIHDRVHEPVLRMLVRHISEDEIGHYKHFYRYFRKYRATEPCSRAAVLGAIIRRSLEIRREDTTCGLRHAYDERYSGAVGMAPDFDEVRRAANSLIGGGVPFALAAAMWLRPLQLDHRLEKTLRRAFPLAARALVF
jgi:rubrerythrin